MPGIQWLMFVILTFLWTLSGAETDESCVFMETCVLPCSFQSGRDVVIHWIQLTVRDLTVHSYYYNQDQVTSQDHHFKGRTSLFKDQISGGNASLQLTGVQVQDQGRYKCYTSTVTGNKESFINLKVDAPVCKVSIEQVGNMITCSSEGIYPQPELTWSINPPSNVTNNTTTRVQQTEQQLYNISSSLILSEEVSDVVYSCTVTTCRNKKTATLLTSKKSPDVQGRGRVGTISAAAAAAAAATALGLTLYLKREKRETKREGTNEGVEILTETLGDVHVHTEHLITQ